MGNLLALQPVGTATFSDTAVTTTATTTLTVTLAQTYVDADHWRVSQSWTKEYIISQSAGDPLALGPWSSSTRSRLTTFSITVSNGYGVPSLPAVSVKHASSTASPSSSSASASLASSAVSTLIPIGPVATVIFTDLDTLNTSQGASTDNSNVTTGKVDKTNSMGNSKFTAKRNFGLNEFLVMRSSGTLGHAYQASMGSRNDRQMSFKGTYDQFDANGTVVDVAGNPTTAFSHPYGATYSSRGALPATDAAAVMNGTAAPTPLGGNGSRVLSTGSLTESASEGEGVSVTAEAVTDVGEELEESDIHGEVDIAADANGSINVTDQFSYDDQESDATTGDHEYLSLGWDEIDNASVGAGFEMDISLDDADLPDPENSSGNSSSSSSSSSGSYSGGGGVTGGSGPAGGGPSSSGGSPTQGAPILDLETKETVGSTEKTFLQFDYKATKITSGSGGNPLSTPMTINTTGSISLRLGGGATVSADLQLSNLSITDLIPKLTMPASGDTTVTYVSVNCEDRYFGFDDNPPEGYNMLISEKERHYHQSETTSATLSYNLTATIDPTTSPSVAGTLAVNIERHVRDDSSCYSHVKIQKISDPTDTYEFWSRARGAYIGSVITTGSMGNGTNSLTTTVKENVEGVSEIFTTGTPPALPDPAEGAPSTTSQVLDWVQLGLDVAGMIPIAGEVCDVTNAIIHAARGNPGEAMVSLAGAIPFGGTAVTAGKLSQKVIKALGKNADKLDEVAAGVKAIFKKADDVPQSSATKFCFPAGTLVTTEFGKKPIEQVASGENVWSYDLATNQWRLCQVRQTFTHNYNGHSVLVTVADETIEATLLHPFWVVSGESLDSRPIRDHLPRVPTNATTPGRWVDAGDLQSGDLVLLRNGERYRIQNVQIQPYQNLVYNFEVADLHNYAVGNWQVLVHNNNGKDALHKVEPCKEKLTTSEIIAKARQQDGHRPLRPKRENLDPEQWKRRFGDDMY